MLYFKNGSRVKSAISGNIAIENKASKTSIEILNAVIQELREAQINIQKVSVFEDPLEAIIHIRTTPHQSVTRSWFRILDIFKTDETAMLFLKLRVQNKLNTRTPYLLKYQILPSLA